MLVFGSGAWIDFVVGRLLPLMTWRIYFWLWVCVAACPPGAATDATELAAKESLSPGRAAWYMVRGAG